MQLQAERTIVLDESEAVRLGHGVEDFLRKLRELQSSRRGHDKSVAVNTKGADLCGLFDEHSSAPFIVVCLPDSAVGALPALVESPVDVFNDYSGDLMSKYTYLQFSGGHHQLWLSTMSLDAALDHAFEKDELFLVVYCGAKLWARRLTSTTLGDAEMLMCEIQSAEGSTGPNYRPVREFTPKQLRAASGRAAREAVLLADKPCYLFRPEMYVRTLRQ
jgi:hypothetical protein